MPGTRLVCKPGGRIFNDETIVTCLFDQHVMCKDSHVPALPHKDRHREAKQVSSPVAKIVPEPSKGKKIFLSPGRLINSRFFQIFQVESKTTKE